MVFELHHLRIACVLEAVTSGYVTDAAALWAAIGYFCFGEAFGHYIPRTNVSFIPGPRPDPVYSKTRILRVEPKIYFAGFLRRAGRGWSWPIFTIVVWVFVKFT